jgi:uncharacterized membrane protein
MKLKKSVELSLKVVVIAILVLIFLVVSVLFFKEKFSEGTKKLDDSKSKNLDEIANQIINSANKN